MTTPRQLVKTYADLTIEEADRIVSTLDGYLTATRKERIEEALASRTRDVALVLEDVASEHNASAVLRTAEAFGVLEVHVVPRESEFKLSRKVSIGSHKWIDLKRHPSPTVAYDSLRDRGFSVWASDIHGDTVSLEEIPTDHKVALVFGNEHAGLTREAAEAADGLFKIPMTGFVESLNISVAAAICTYDLVARKRRAGTLSTLDPEDTARLRATWYTLSVRAAPQLLERAGVELPAMSAEPVRFATEEV